MVSDSLEGELTPSSAGSGSADGWMGFASETPFTIGRYLVISASRALANLTSINSFVALTQSFLITMFPLGTRSCLSSGVRAK